MDLQEFTLACIACSYRKATPFRSVKIGFTNPLKSKRKNQKSPERKGVFFIS